jgi:hypothetical protein
VFTRLASRWLLTQVSFGCNLLLLVFCHSESMLWRPPCSSRKSQFQLWQCKKLLSCSKTILVLPFSLTTYKNLGIHRQEQWWNLLSSTTWCLLCTVLNIALKFNGIPNDWSAHPYIHTSIYPYDLILINVLHCIHALESRSFIDWSLYLWLNYRSE